MALGLSTPELTDGLDNEQPLRHVEELAGGMWLDEMGRAHLPEKAISLAAPAAVSAPAPLRHVEELAGGMWLDEQGRAHLPEKAGTLPANPYADPAGEFVKGFAGMGTGLVSLAVDWPAQLFGLKARPGAAMQRSLEEALPSHPEAGFWGKTMPQAAASMAAFALPVAGLAGKAGTLATMGLGAATQSGQAVQEAQAAGAGPGATTAAAVLNAPLGATEAVPFLRFGGAGVRGLERLAPDVVARTVGRRLGKFGATKAGQVLGQVGGGLIEESGQEMGQQLGSNWVARSGAGYDPERALSEGVLESGAAAALLGGGMGLVAGGAYEGLAKHKTADLQGEHADVVQEIALHEALGAAGMPGVGPDTERARGAEARRVEIERELRRRGEQAATAEDVPFESAPGDGSGQLTDEKGQTLAPGVLMPDGTARLTGPGVDLRGPDEMGPPAPTAGSALETLLGLGGEANGNVPGVGGEVPGGGVDTRERAGGGEGGGVGAGLGGAEGAGAPVAARVGEGVASGSAGAGVGAEGEVTATATVPHGGAALPGTAVASDQLPVTSDPRIANLPIERRKAALAEAVAAGHPVAKVLAGLENGPYLADQVNQVVNESTAGQKLARDVLAAGGRDFNRAFDLRGDDFQKIGETLRAMKGQAAGVARRAAASERVGGEVAGELAAAERTPQDRFEQAKMSSRARANEIPAQVAGHTAQVARLTAQAKANKGKAVKGGTFKTTIAAEQARIKTLNEEYTRLLTPAYEADLRVKILGETPEVATARAMADRPGKAAPSAVAPQGRAGQPGVKPRTDAEIASEARRAMRGSERTAQAQPTVAGTVQGNLLSGTNGVRSAVTTGLGTTVGAEPLTLDQARRVVSKGDKAALEAATVAAKKRGLKGPRLRATIWDAMTPAQKVIEKDRRVKIAEKRAQQPVSDDNFVTWLAGVGRMSPGHFHVDNPKTGQGHWTANELADQLGFDPNTTKRTPFWNNLFVGRNGRGLALDELTEALQEHARTMHLFGTGEGGYDSRATTLDILTDLAYKGWDGVSKPATDGEVLDHRAMQDDEQAAFEDYAAETERHSQETAQRLLDEGGLSQERHAALGEALTSAKAGNWTPIMRELPRATKEMGEEEYRFQAAYSPRSPHLQTPLPPSGLRSESLEFLGKNGENVINESAEARAKLPAGEIARRMERIRAQSESRHAYRVAHPEEFPNGKLQAAPERIIQDLEAGLRQRARELGESAERVKMRHAPERATGRAWEMAQEVADRVGTRLVPVEQAGSEPLLFNGFTPSRVRGTMLLNVDGAQNPLSLVVGHEALHQIADELGRDHPMVKRLFSLLWEATKNKGDMFEKYSRAYGRSDGEFVIEEFAGDALAQAIHSPGFWRRVAAKDMGLFARLWAAVKRMLGGGGQVGTSDLGSAQAGAMYDAEALMTEAGISRVREAMETLYREYVATKRGRVWARVEARLAEGRAQAAGRTKDEGRSAKGDVAVQGDLFGRATTSVTFPGKPTAPQNDLFGYQSEDLGTTETDKAVGRGADEGKVKTPDMFGGKMQTAPDEAGRDVERFGGAVDRLLKGMKPSEGLLWVRQNTPKVLLDLGMKDLRVSVSPRVVEKVLHSPEHGLSVDLLKELPRLLERPVAVFDSATQKGSLVVLTKAEIRGKPVMVALAMAVKQGHHEVHAVSSMYQRDVAHFESWAKKGLLRYVDKAQAPKWLQSAGLQLPMEAAPFRGSEGIIPPSGSQVKGKVRMQVAGPAEASAQETTPAPTTNGEAAPGVEKRVADAVASMRESHGVKADQVGFWKGLGESAKVHVDRMKAAATSNFAHLAPLQALAERPYVVRTADGNIARGLAGGVERFATLEDAQTYLQKMARRHVGTILNGEAGGIWGKGAAVDATGAPSVALMNTLTTNLRRQQEHKEVALQKAKEEVRSLTEPLLAKAAHLPLFEDLVYARDLSEYMTMQQGLVDTGELDRVRMPHEWDPEAFKVFQDRTEAEAAKPGNEAVVKAAAGRAKFFVEMGKTSEELGVLRPGQAKFKEYYSHRITQYERIAAAAKNPLPRGPDRLEAPKGRGYQHERVSSELAYNTDVRMVDKAVIAQMYEDQANQRLLNWVRDSKLNIKDSLVKQADDANEAKGGQGKQVTWQELVPEGHKAFEIYPGVRWASLKGDLEQANQDMLREIFGPAASKNIEDFGLAMKPLQLVVPEEVAAQLLDLNNDAYLGKASAIGKIGKPFMGAWKNMILTTPAHLARYTLNNGFGDGEAMVIGEPQALLSALRKGQKWGTADQVARGKAQWNQVFKDLWDFHGKGKASTSLLRAMEAGAVGSGMTGIDVMGGEALSGLKPTWEALTKGLSEAKSPGESAKIFAKAIAGAWWKGGKFANEFRENVLRYKAFLFYEDAIANGADHELTGASRRKSLEGLDGTLKAGKLAAELLIDYRATTVLGRVIGENFIPFYSWVEGNPKRFKRILGNIWADPSMHGWDKIIKSLPPTASVGLRIGIVAGLAALWNRLWQDDEDRKGMDQYAKQRGYLAVPFSKDAKGGQRYIRTQSNVGDLLEWVGAYDYPQIFNDLAMGRTSIARGLLHIPEAAVNKIFTGLTPGLSTGYTLMSGKTMWPSVFDQRPARGGKDVVLASLFGIDTEYLGLKNLFTPVPVKGANGKFLPSSDYMLGLLGMKYNDPGAAYYSQATETKHRFMSGVLGKESGGSDYQTPKAQVARLYRLAVKYGDDGAKRRLQAQLLTMGVKGQQGLKDLLESADPRAGIPKKYWGRYEAWMSPEERRIEAQARAYYMSTFKV